MAGPRRAPDQDELAAVPNAMVLKLSPKSALVSAGGREVWVPFSVIEVEDLARMAPNARFAELKIAAWFAKREKLA